MEAGQLEVRFYRGANGRIPFLEWLDQIQDKRAIAAIQTRLDRVEAGNLGDAQAVGDRVGELRIHYGAGIRLYYARDGRRLMILLCGGTKRRQDHDIKQAKNYWKEYQDRGER